MKRRASARDQAGGALCGAHVPRRRPAADASSFTSLRRAPHRLAIGLVERVHYDPAQAAVFYNFQGLRIRSKQDVADVRQAVEAVCRPIGKKVAAIVNYDDFQIDESVIDDYSAMVQGLTATYYTQVSRYTTSAFMRLKLGEALEQRGVSAHIYETRQEALDSARL